MSIHLVLNVFYVALWLGQRATGRSHLHFPAHQTARATEIGVSDHAAAVARQRDYVHSLLLGNQRFPSHIHSLSSSTSALNCCLRAFKGTAWITRELININASPNSPQTPRWSLEQHGPIESKSVPLVTLEFTPDGCIHRSTTCWREGKSA